ncbi:MAG: hypothetical protein U0Q16_35310 [Bryobacteraceae bacterium]
MRTNSLANRPIVPAAAILLACGGVLHAADAKLYLQAWMPPVDQYFENPQSLAGPPDGQFGGSPHTWAYGRYSALFDFGAPVTASTLEVTHKGWGFIGIAVSMNVADLIVPYGDPLPPHYYWNDDLLKPVSGQTETEVRTTQHPSTSGPRTFRYAMVFLFNPWYQNFGAGVWLDSIGVPISKAFVETSARDTARAIETLDVGLFNGPNAQTNAGRRNALANRASEAAAFVAVGNLPAAQDELQSLLQKVDGIAPPPDWMNDSPEKRALAFRVSQLITWIAMMSR